MNIFIYFSMFITIFILVLAFTYFLFGYLYLKVAKNNDKTAVFFLIWYASLTTALIMIILSMGGII